MFRQFPLPCNRELPIARVSYSKFALRVGVDPRETERKSFNPRFYNK